jgi:hypothetical protein
LLRVTFWRIEFVGGSKILENMWTPVDCLKSVSVPLSRAIAGEDNVVTFFSVCELSTSAQEKELNMTGDSTELFCASTRVTTSNDQRWKPR